MIIYTTPICLRQFIETQCKHNKLITLLIKLLSRSTYVRCLSRSLIQSRFFIDEKRAISGDNERKTRLKPSVATERPE